MVRRVVLRVVAGGRGQVGGQCGDLGFQFSELADLGAEVGEFTQDLFQAGPGDRVRGQPGLR